MNVYLTDESGSRIPVVFKEVMLVPKLEKSLISIGKLTERGDVTFGKKSAGLAINGRKFLLGWRRGNMFKMECGVVASCYFASVDGCAEESVNDEYTVSNGADNDSSEGNVRVGVMFYHDYFNKVGPIVTDVKFGDFDVGINCCSFCSSGSTNNGS